MRHAALVGEAAELLIGEFAQRCRLPISTLRYYDRIGLLTPAAVDEANGYRRYRTDQLPTAELIARLRVLGVGPAQIAEIVAGGDGATAALVRERSRVNAELAAGQVRLHELDELLATETPTDYRVDMRELMPRQVAVQEYSAAFDEQEPVVIRAIGALRTQLRRTGHTRADAWGGTFPLDLEDQITGYVFTAVHGDGGGLTMVELPGGSAVSTTHRGGPATLSLAYLALFAEIDRLGATPRAPVIEEYVSRSELRVSILFTS
jgi:DNA-binding transcriptional MerR regulator